MKRITILLSLIALYFFNSSSIRVGLIDLNAILNSMPETAEVEKKLIDLQNRYQTELENIGKEFQRQYTEIQNLPPDEPAAIKEIKINALQETQKKEDSFNRRVMEDLVLQRDSLMAPIYNKIQKCIETTSEENGVDLVMEKGQNGKIYYFNDKVVDLTPVIIENINE